MELAEYLNALQNCPDKKLQRELGINDNWPIFLNADFESVVQYFKKSEFYVDKGQTKNEEGKTGRTHIFRNVRKTVDVQIFDWLGPSWSEFLEEEQRLEKDYNMTIMLHQGYNIIDYAKMHVEFFQEKFAKGKIPEGKALAEAYRLRKLAEKDGHNENIYWARAIAEEVVQIGHFLIIKSRESVPPRHK